MESTETRPLSPSPRSAFWVEAWYVQPSLNRVSHQGNTVQVEPRVQQTLESFGATADEGSAVLFEAANPRHAHEVRCFEGRVLDDDQVLVAGVIRCAAPLRRISSRMEHRNRFSHLKARRTRSHPIGGQGSGGFAA